MVDVALAEDMNGIIPEEPQEFRHATSLDGALQHLIPTLQTNKGLTFTSLDGLSLRFSTPAVVARQHYAASRRQDHLQTYGVLLPLRDIITRIGNP